MNINRRSAIRYFIIVGAGTLLLPTCKPAAKKIRAFNNLPINEDDEAMLTEVAETIIPATKTPGSKELNVSVFALQMLNDCYEQSDRDKFLKGMQQFNKNVKEKYDKTFVECSPKEQENIVASLNNQKDSKEDVAFFYNTMKQLTIKGYTNSKYYLSNIQIYQIVPGKFKASVPVT